MIILRVNNSFLFVFPSILFHDLVNLAFLIHLVIKIILFFFLLWQLDRIAFYDGNDQSLLQMPLKSILYDVIAERRLGCFQRQLLLYTYQSFYFYGIICRLWGISHRLSMMLTAYPVHVPSMKKAVSKHGTYGGLRAKQLLFHVVHPSAN